MCIFKSIQILTYFFTLTKRILSISEVRKKPSETHFSVFLSDGGPPKHRGAQENFPLPPLSTGLVLYMHIRIFKA